MIIPHAERRTSHALDHHPIPPITDPDGRYWDQPARELITIDNTHALMTLGTFKMLCNYSSSYPSGVYPGKMWRRHDGAHDRAFIAAGGKPHWLLCWYGYSPQGPAWVSTYYRHIILSDADIEAIK